MAKFCTNCGAKLHEDSVFCEVCGTRVEQAVQPQAPVSNPSPERPVQYDMGGNYGAPYERKGGGRKGKSGVLTLALLGGAAVLMVLTFSAIMFGCKGKGEPSPIGTTAAPSTGKNSPYFQLKEENGKEATGLDKRTEYADPFVKTDSAEKKDYTEAFTETAPETERFSDQITQGLTSGIEIAQKLSTSENAQATDFEWLLDYILYDGYEAGQVITDSAYSNRIIDDADALNGGWKAYMFTDDGVYGSDVERYFNVEIDTDGSRFNMIVNWKYMFDPSSGSSIDETGSDKFEGNYDGGSASCQSNYAKIDMSEFYLSNDGETEYAVGTFYWISGEVDCIGLMRSAR